MLSAANMMCSGLNSGFPAHAMLRAQVQQGMECMAWVKGQHGFEQPDVG
jgi:hypothetical protein